MANALVDLRAGRSASRQGHQAHARGCVATLDDRSPGAGSRDVALCTYVAPLAARGPATARLPDAVACDPGTAGAGSGTWGSGSRRTCWLCVPKRFCARVQADHGAHASGTVISSPVHAGCSMCHWNASIMAGRAACPGGATEGSRSPRSRLRKARRFPRMRISRPRRRPRHRACPRMTSSAMSVHRMEEAAGRQRRPATLLQGWQRSLARFQRAWSAGRRLCRSASNL